MFRFVGDFIRNNPIEIYMIWIIMFLFIVTIIFYIIFKPDYTNIYSNIKQL